MTLERLKYLQHPEDKPTTRLNVQATSYKIKPKQDAAKTTQPHQGLFSSCRGHSSKLITSSIDFTLSSPKWARHSAEMNCLASLHRWLEDTERAIKQEKEKHLCCNRALPRRYKYKASACDMCVCSMCIISGARARWCDVMDQPKQP